MFRKIIGATFCSGIGAPEVAAPWVDWQLASEIEAFPREVLEFRHGCLDARHHKSGPRLWGDMTALRPRHFRKLEIPLPNLIVAGTPCQAFSVAGLRKGTADDRGNLTLKFVELCHAIVAARPDGKLAALWENVPGVLSDKTNAFGAFLGGLVGALDALPQPAGGSWPGEGMVEGPRARAAWAVLDARWFGVAQRRRRVFVVVDFGGAVDPAAVLLEPDSLRGDTPARGWAGQDVAGTVSARTEGGGGLKNQHALNGAGLFVPDVSPALNTGSNQKTHTPDLAAYIAKRFDDDEQVSRPILAKGNSSHRADAETYIWERKTVPPELANTLTARMGKGVNTTISEGQTPIPVCVTGETTHALTAEGFDASEDGTGRGTPVIAFGSKDHGADAMTELSPTLRAGGHDGSHANAGVPPAIAIQERAVSENPKAGPDGVGVRADDTAYTLEARQTVQAVAFDTTQITSPENRSNPKAGDPCHPLAAGAAAPAIIEAWAVRRLTPRECERLQGFPDDFTLIPRDKRRPLKGLALRQEVRFLRETMPDLTIREALHLAADGPRYKALGNSMAVPVIAYILDRMRDSMGEANGPT